MIDDACLGCEKFTVFQQQFINQQGKNNVIVGYNPECNGVVGVSNEIVIELI